MNNLGLGIQGFISGEHNVADSSTVLQWKICENCGYGFARPYAFFAKEGVKYCADCRKRSLQPNNDDLYREVLRSEGLSERDLPRQECPDLFSPHRRLIEWQPILTAQFFAHPEGLTIIDIAEITHRSRYSVPNMLAKAGYRLVKIARRNPAEGTQTRYQMAELCESQCRASESAVTSDASIN